MMKMMMTCIATAVVKKVTRLATAPHAIKTMKIQMMMGIGSHQLGLVIIKIIRVLSLSRRGRRSASLKTPMMKRNPMIQGSDFYKLDILQIKN